MSEAKHTPGPWRLVERETLEDGSIYPRHIATEDGGYQICLLESANMASLGYERTPSEQERDRLICAAPDLLEALQELVTGMVYLHGDKADGVLKAARAAIAKAVQQ